MLKLHVPDMPKGTWKIHWSIVVNDEYLVMHELMSYRTVQGGVWFGMVWPLLGVPNRKLMLSAIT